MRWHCIHCGTPLFRMVLNYDYANGAIIKHAPVIVWIDSLGGTWSQDTPCPGHAPNISEKVEEAREVFGYVSRVIGRQ